MTIREWLAEATQQLTDAEVTSPRLDALVLLEYVLKTERSSLIAHDEDLLQGDQLSQLNSLLEQRSLRMPIAYLTGYREFYGLAFEVNQHVLIPRPETEILVEYAIRYAPKNAAILELGTGSGGIAISVSKNRPDTSVDASDISFEALEVAQRNNEAQKTNVSFSHSDLFETVRGTYDVILANLPYVPESEPRQPEITFEPDVSLYSTNDGLDIYRAFFDQLTQHLKPSGICLVEFNPNQFLSAQKYCTPLGLDVQPLSDYIYRVHAL